MAQAKVKTQKVSASKAQMNDSSLPTNYAEISRLHGSALANYKGTLVVTSSRMGEGASLYAHLMAQRSADLGQKVLLIDLNMKSGSLTSTLKAEAAEWELESHKATDKFKDIIQNVTGVKNLSLMPMPSDADTIAYLKDVRNVSAFFESLEKEYDHIIVDTTPVGLMNRGNIDPVLLAAAAKRTVLVMLAGVTPRRVVLRALNQLKESGAQVVGVVANDRDNPSTKVKMIKFVNAIQKVAPGLSDWLRHKIMHAGQID